MAKSENNTLSITRTIDASRDKVWRCWTEPDLLKQWFCPKPWTIPVADIDVRPGGRSNLTMAGPNGERVENIGSYLEVIPQEKLIMTDGFSENYMPRPDHFMTSVVELSDAGEDKTQIVWSARHGTVERRDQHVEMGIMDGWPICLEQMEALAKTL